jgi:hypothetical protein
MEYPSCVAEKSDPQAERTRAGLCADCVHARRVYPERRQGEAARASAFYLCELSATDPAFPKYPCLPVLRCEGYEPSG